MKIVKLKKLKDNRYEVLFDNDIKFTLYDDIIVKYELLFTEIVDAAVLKDIEEENKRMATYYDALKYIGRKMRNEKEIREYLRRKEYEDGDIETTVKRLMDEGFLNNKTYISAYVSDQVNLSNNGYYKILNDLIRMNFSEEEIREELDKIDDEEWVLRCEKVIKKKVSANRTYSGNKLKDKLVYELCNIGYLKEMVVGILENMVLSDDTLLIKEYDKLRVKLEKKYSGKELNYQIRTKLLVKGFNFDDIGNLFEE